MTMRTLKDYADMLLTSREAARRAGCVVEPNEARVAQTLGVTIDQVQKAHGIVELIEAHRADMLRRLD